MCRFVRMQVSAKESRKGVEELLNRRWNMGQGSGSGRGWGVGGGDDLKCRVVKKLMMCRIDEKVVSREEVVADDGS
jgi:hypothetical protein